jgi:hypothetical protein
MSGIKAGITSEKLIYESHFIVRIAPETRKRKKNQDETCYSRFTGR